MNYGEELRMLVQESCDKFHTIPLQHWVSKPSPDKWSKKEILGHLVDSAYNNHRRLVVTQYEQNDKIVYRQDDWVAINGYQSIPLDEVILLWRTLNLQIIRLMESMPKAAYHFTCDTGKGNQDLKTIEFLMEDYIVHMKHHLGAMFK